ncbi:MAG: glycosyltransferase family 2 protein [Actinomycetota bacterium]|nr:glycosyltransferase family 2 protein [Actinomycetota bacterium]
MTVSVAIPVRNGGATFPPLLDAIRAQRIDREVEIVVADNESTDGSREEAERRGAVIVDVPRDEFSHGGTRDLLMRAARGEHVAFVTDDVFPDSETWLAELVAGFGDAENVGLVYGPYLPRPDASPSVARELTEFFAALSPDGRPRVDRGLPDDLRPGPVTFYTDANGCVARAAWERVPFRPVTNAEDHVLAIDMLRAGYAKVYRPSAAVIHSHDPPPLERFRHMFDEFRALREIYGHVEEAGWPYTPAVVRRGVRRDRAWLRAQGRSGSDLDRATLDSLLYHCVRTSAAILGTRADRLPPAMRRVLSRDRRDRFDPL